MSERSARNRRLTRAGGRLDRRELLLAASSSLLATLFGAACSGRDGAGAPARQVTRPGTRQLELWSWFDLPLGDPRSRELSGIAWDAKEGVLWAVHDASPSIVALVPDAGLRTWRFGESVEIETGDAVDLEGVVIVRDGFIVCSEVGPQLIEVDRTGRLRGKIPLPPRFYEARTNKSLESLTMSPSGRYLFTTTEVALEQDGASATHSAGTRVRILRMDRQGSDVTEHAYETDRVPYDVGDWGVSDLAALGDAELLVLERGWSRGLGNTARVYQTSLDARASCLGIEQLSSTSPALAKELRVDLAKVVATGLPAPKQPQPAPLLDNYEGIALGPRLPDGRQSVLMISDDNGRADQFARVLVLAL